MAIPISHSELYGHRPTDQQFTELISAFKTGPTFISLAMWDFMISLSEGDAAKYKYLQGFFIHNLVRPDLRAQVLHKAARDSDAPRPIFGRWQLLALMKKVLLETTDDGDKDPRTDDAARRTLGDACLMLNDLLFPEEQMERLKDRGGTEERERIHDELMTQWLCQIELAHPPDVYQAVARNDEYFSIFDQPAAEFAFTDGQTLAQRFEHLTGLGIHQYLRLYVAVFALHSSLEAKHPEEINANPGVINFDKELIFSLMDFRQEEQDIFFRRVVADLPRLIQGVKKDAASARAWQFDFTTFRDYPLVAIPENPRGFTCIAFPFLIEKLASGIYHTILNSWPAGDPERDKFQSYWGKVFEQFVNDRLRDEYPPSTLAKRLYENPYFNRKRNRSIEVSDAALDYGDALVLLERKGGYLSLNEKYSDDASKLLMGVAEKFGMEKVIRQLSRSIGMIFNEDEGERDCFSERVKRRRPVDPFNPAAIRKVYPVLVVQDFAMTLGFMNRRLRLQFKQKMQEHRLRPQVQVRPLSLLTVENLENVLAHIGEITLPEVLDEYAREEHDPLTTFNGILDQYLRARGANVKRRYRWSVKKCAEVLDSIKERFKDVTEFSY